MKTFICVLLLLLVPVVAFAEFSSVGFRTYSSATAMSCSVMAGNDANGAFVPNPGTSSVKSLGTKGTETYTPTGADTHLKVICFPTVAGLSSTTTTRVAVKMFFNGSETFYFPITDAFLKIK